MKTILIYILAILLSISAYSQAPSQYHKPKTGKRTSIHTVYNGTRDRHVPTEGDGTGDKIMGEKTKHLKNMFNKFISQRQKFATRKYKLKSSGGAAIKPSR